MSATPNCEHERPEISCDGEGVYKFHCPDCGRLAFGDRTAAETLGWVRKANARLIAAAPELLDECLITLRDLVTETRYSEEGRRKRIAQLEAVIDKAEEEQ